MQALRRIFGRAAKARPASEREDDPEAQEAETAEAFVDSVLEADDSTTLRILHQPENVKDIDLDIVAVHGLGGGNISTWKDKPSGKVWLRDFLKNSPQYKNARILSFGYDARPFLKTTEPRTTGRIFTFGEDLISALNDNRIGKTAQMRPIIFVGHSLGGIVIKSALVYARLKPTLYSSIVDATKAVLFMGTPHQGADIASWIKVMGGFSKSIGLRSTTVMGQLSRWSEPLIELNTLFSEQISDLQITTFYEKLPTYGVMVVHEASARLGNLKNEVVVGMDRNHLTICKFSDEKDGAYESVQKRFDAVAGKIAEEASNTSSSLEERLSFLPPPASLPDVPVTEREELHRSNGD